MASVAPQPKLNMSLAKLLPELTLPKPIASMAIRGVTIDSRQVEPGFVFIALSGERVDGRQFIGKAIAAGAVAILVESTLKQRAGEVEIMEGAAMISVANLADRISDISSQFYGVPSESLRVVGVTGTNGKSTCVSLIAQLYQLTTGRSGTLGTLGAQFNGSLFDFGMTTPDVATCQRMLAAMRDENIELVAMEVSSHGLAQNRVAGIRFDTAIFTNLTHDHLDYHRDMQHYASVKQQLFELPDLNNAVINLDDAYAGQMLAAAKRHAKVYTYSLLHFVADVFATDIEYSPAGVEFRLHCPWGEADIQSPLLGEFNVSNLLAAMTAVLASGAEFEQVVAEIPRLSSVNGRMDRLNLDSDIAVVIDFAHTPDALEHAIRAIRAHVEGRLWVVFGCGGDRDRSKRPLMAKVAEQSADVVVVTSDNPRAESAEKIIADVCQGFERTSHIVIVDREQAIRYAIENAEAGDVVLLAGKGHENYQVIGEQKLDFSDAEHGIQALQNRAGPIVREDQP